jgi:preprotein translocase SecE subunit
MATAVQTGPSAKAASPKARLLAASFAGAVFLLAGVALVGYGVPQLLRGANLGNPFIAAFVRVAAQVAAIVGLVYVGSKLAGENPPKGVRGGIFMVISTIITIFFLVRAVGLNANGPAGPIVTAVAGLALLYGGWWFLNRPQTVGWMYQLEDQGWFHTHGYKRTQGLKLRRYTIIGILLVGLSGVWTMIHHQTIGTGDLRLAMPFDWPTLTVLSDKQYAVPLLLTAATLWVAWRAVNVPPFADFLVATEAEMNKVSWSSRKKLFQDTAVVLITTLMLTGFLLVVDLFWGWALSNRYVGVLPTAKPKDSKQVQKAEW